MILLREIQERDLAGLERLAQIPGFINLQNDREFLMEKIERSRESFGSSGCSGREPSPDAKYIFIAEDTSTGAVLGTSMIAAQHGTEEIPHYYFQVGSEERISHSIGTGFIHGTLELHQETCGPSEIGGLVLDPEHRNTSARLGRQVSFVRFLYLAMNRVRFRDQILAELLPPLNKKGQSPLWEAIGRRFTNMDYWEADRLSQQDKEFIFALFPEGKIYTTFLPAEARNAIGKVGKDTEPVFHMLNKIGFRYAKQVDPFDGGPHLWVKTDELLPVKGVARAPWRGFLDVEPGAGAARPGLVCRTAQAAGTFRAAHVDAECSADGVRFLRVADRAERDVLSRSLSLSVGDEIAFMPYY